jgi:hypothetical protein
MRLVTRGDLDGLTCAVLISQNESIDDILLIHPQDITDRRVAIRRDDILANVPYHPDCAVWFDHHLQTQNNARPPAVFKGAYGHAPSAARLVYDYFGGRAKMPQYSRLVLETDRLDAANLTPRDVTDPQGFIRLGFTLDGRTGLGAFEDYFKWLVRELRERPDDAIVDHPKVQERWQRIAENEARFRELTEKHSRLDGNVVITDFRPLDETPIGNRFLVYALFPTANVSVRIHWGPERSFPIVAVGHSIFNRSCKTSVGDLMSRWGGGGHRGAGTTPLKGVDGDAAIAEIIATLKKNG